MNPRLLALCLGLAATAAAGACTDPTRLRAQFETMQDTLVAFAMTGTPSTYPSALAAAVQQDDDPSGEPAVVRLGGAIPFDVAFDIDAEGNAVVYPLRLLVSDFRETRRVGLQRATTPFEQVLRAPSGGYQFDSAMVARRGDVIVIESQLTPYCSLDVLQTIYAKLTVDSVSTAARTVYFRVGLDPNCGFRSFAPGIPGD